MSDEEHSDNGFYYPKEQEKSVVVAIVGILTKLKQAEITV